ncbi:hypothetical protein RBH94_12315 [Aestuariibaculum sp. YM273]|uniref:hypothetical protein n=1 Tax=Aestuariibaculum sp. YM273 TaxID=3070659 RepID=UPI0027DCE0A1|nr:hypothetical protein [Aestuariibaculum sp. YM273]WMI64841.1 hypothetical protein RBH94_12315 [Aestuariibaculum sp. YM273]
MLFKTTYRDKEITKQINHLVGNSFSLWKILKLKGIGSKRLIIDETSPNLNSILNKVGDINYGNIELRPKGILIHITKGLERFVWGIPYFKLVIYKTNGLSIHADGMFIYFRKNKTFNESKPFFNKLLEQKIKFDEQYNFHAF